MKKEMYITIKELELSFYCSSHCQIVLSSAWQLSRTRLTLAELVFLKPFNGPIGLHFRLHNKGHIKLVKLLLIPQRSLS